MADQDRTPLQDEVASAIARSDKARDHFDSLLKKKLDTTGKPLWDIERGKVKNPSPRVLRAIEEVLGLEPDYLVDLVHPREETRSREPDQPRTRDASAGELVPVIQVDLSFPMGPEATIDDYVEEEPRTFDLAYIRAFTRTPPARLRIARGVGDSMFPTLAGNDQVWIDTTQNDLRHADRIYAVTINGGAAIKRLRPLRDGRVLIVSDNPMVENYEVDGDEIRIAGRVIRFARDV